MQMTQLGASGIQVSRVCLGTMTFGEQTGEEEAFRQMDEARARGINFFDTAEMYAVPPRPETQGATERIIGAWMKQRGARDKIILATKVAGRSQMTWTRTPDMLDGGEVRLTRKQIDFAIEQSLKRLQTDYVDLYQVHWPDRNYRGFGFHTYRDYDDDYVSFENILESLARHVEAGKIRAIGVSNESPWGVMSLLREAEKRGWPRIVSIQNAYNLVNRRFETGGLAEIAMREKVGLLAYSPLAQGYLTGKYRHGVPADSRKGLFDRLQRYEGPMGVETINRYLDLAAELKVSPIALALKFVDTRAWTTSTIIGATTHAQLREVLAGFELEWTRDIEKAVNAIHASQVDPCP